MYIKSVQEAKALKTPSGKSVRWLLSGENGVPNFEMRYFEVEKGIEGKEESHSFEHEGLGGRSLLNLSCRFLSG